MSAQPIWDDSGQGDLLALVTAGNPASPSANDEWVLYVQALKSSRDAAGLIRPNTLRPMVRGKVAPKRLGAFVSAAVAADLIEFSGEWQVSDDHEGRNAGRPCRIWRWIGGE